MSNLSARSGYLNSRFLGVLIFIFALLFLLSMILARTDANISLVFDVFSGKKSITDITVEQQFLLEAILPNIIGAIFASIFQNHLIISISWIVFGIVLIFISLYYLDVKNLIDIRTIILTILFSYIVKILLTWIGKSDSYLLTFLLIATFSNSRSGKIVSSCCAALCHPQIAILALVFLESERLLLFNKIQIWNLLGVAVGVALDRIAVSFIATDIVGRSEYIANHIADMIFGGLFDAGSLFALTLAPPLLLFVLAGLINVSSFKEILKFNYIPFYAMLVVAFIISCFFTFDRSRVFVLITFPGYIYFLHLFRERLYLFLTEKTLVSSLIAILMLAMPQSDFTGWRGSSSVAKVVTRRLAPDVAARRFSCTPGCDPIAQSTP